PETPGLPRAGDPTKERRDALRRPTRPASGRCGLHLKGPHRSRAESPLYQSDPRRPAAAAGEHRMSHVYGLDEAGLKLAATAADIAPSPPGAHARRIDAEARFPEESVAALAAAGLLGLTVAPALGGRGHGPGTFAAVVEELAQVCASTAMVYVMHVSAAQAIAVSATLAGRDDLLRAVAAGRHLTTLAFSERGSRSQFWAPVSRLEAADGGFRVSASKSWVTAAERADSYV